MKTILSALVILGLLAPAAAHAKVKTEAVEYKAGDTVLEGLWAWHDGPEVKGKKRPAVIIVHEWMGPGEYTKQRAQQLAAMGYVAFAADIYGKGVRPKNHEEAGKAAGMLRENRDLMRQRAQAAIDLVAADKRVDATKIAAIGYCFGGTTVLEMARMGADLDLVASFHGSLAAKTPAEAGKVKAKVVVFQGGADKHTIDDVPALSAEMDAAKADWTIVTLGGAVHSFTVKSAGNDPSKGSAYDEKADLRSWGMLEMFLEEAFK